MNVEEKIKKERRLFFIIIPTILIIALIGISFAFFNYTRTGSANVIKVGRISFVTRQTETINLTNVFPIDKTNINTDTDNVDEVVIEIEGDTDYADGIEYLVSSVDSNIYTSTGQIVPISLDFTVNGLGTPNTNYFTARESKNANIYKKIVGDTLVGDQMLLVGYITKNNSSGTKAGVDGSITIKAYLDKNKILISDTYDGTESDNMGTPNSMAQGKTVLTTTEWNALQSSGLSFKVKVEANEGIWVNGSLEEIMRKSAVMDNTTSTYVTDSAGIDFGAISSDTNGKGVYMRAGTENDAYPIVYYRGAVEDNNVLFANKCWKAVRTTDTGGVKLIYNGESSAVYGEIPLTESQYTIPSGATNNFTFNSTDNSWEISITDNIAKEISFTVPAGDNYKLVQTGTSGSSCGGSFTFYKNGTSVNGGSNGGGGAMNLTHNFGTLTSTDVIKMNYSGSSSSTCEITFKLQMIGLGDLITENGCDNTGESTHIDVSGSRFTQFSGNNLYNSPAYVGYMYGTVYSYSTSNWTSNAKFGSGFTWDGTNYKLVDATVTTPNDTHHYSCNSTDAEATCTSIRYVYWLSGSNKYYITISDGKGIEEAIQDMQTNTTSSNAKTQIDSWYASNMNTVTNKLEDTIWCNDRSIGRYNGWSSTGTINGTSDYKNYSLLFGAHERSNYASGTSTVKNQPSLACANKNDAFTVSNGAGNGKLQYPVAMLTEDEIVLAGGLAGSLSTFYLNKGSTYYWSLSPSHFSGTNANEFYVGNGYIGNYSVNNSYGLRPSVSLKPGQLITKGIGTVNDPYVIE